MWSLQCIVYSIQFAQRAVCSVQFVVFRLKCSVCNMQFTVCSFQWAVFSFSLKYIVCRRSLVTLELKNEQSTPDVTLCMLYTTVCSMNKLSNIYIYIYFKSIDASVCLSYSCFNSNTPNWLNYKHFLKTKVKLNKLFT